MFKSKNHQLMRRNFRTMFMFLCGLLLFVQVSQAVILARFQDPVMLQDDNQRLIVRYKTDTGDDSVFVFFTVASKFYNGTDTIKYIALSVGPKDKEPRYSEARIVTIGRAPTVSIDSLHFLHLAYIDESGILSYRTTGYCMRDNSPVGTWSEPVVIASGRCPSIDVEPDGQTVHFLWSYLDTLYYAYLPCPISRPSLTNLGHVDSRDYQLAKGLYGTESFAITYTDNKIMHLKVGYLNWNEWQGFTLESVPLLDSTGSHPRITMSGFTKPPVVPGYGGYKATNIVMVYMDSSDSEIGCQSITGRKNLPGPGSDTNTVYSAELLDISSISKSFKDPTFISIDDIAPLVPEFSFTFQKDYKLYHAHVGFSYEEPHQTMKFDTVSANVFQSSLGYRDYRDSIVDIIWTSPFSDDGAELNYLRVPKQLPLISSIETPQPINTDSVLTVSPNPFNPETRINFTLSEFLQASKIKFAVYGTNGQIVRTINPGHGQGSRFSVLWDGKDNSGKAVSSGVYVFQVVTPKEIRKAKLLLIR